MNASGIYKIQSICKPERAYIGSAVNFSIRWKQHLYLLRKGIHHSPKLQRHYDKYGQDDLVFVIIEPCLPQFLTDIEDTYLHPVKPYFNICSEAGSLLDFRHSEESINQMRESHLGKHHSAETIELMKKRRHSEETLKKMSDIHIGQVSWNKGKTGVSKETHIKMCVAQKNNKHALGQVPWNKGKIGMYSEETLQLMRKPKSEEHIQKMRKPKSEEGRQNIAEARRLRAFNELKIA